MCESNPAYCDCHEWVPLARFHPTAASMRRAREALDAVERKRMGVDFYLNPPQLTDEEQLDQWTDEYNAAIANGLYMKARLIGRRIDSLTAMIHNKERSEPVHADPHTPEAQALLRDYYAHDDARVGVGLSLGQRLARVESQAVERYRENDAKPT